MNAVIYARYSSHAQRDTSIDQQVRECEEFAERNNLNVIKVYADRAVSGKTDNRPEFQDMITDAARGHFKAVIVYQLDRFARNRYDSATYKSRLKKHGIRVLSAKENITDDPAGILMESVLEGMAEYYSAELSQKIKRGMADGARKGRVLGSLVLGYKHLNEQIVLDPLTAPLVKEIFMRYASGEKMKSIQQYAASKGHGLTYNRLHALLTNKKYIGIYTWGDIEVENGLPAIVDDILFKQVQKRIQINKHAPARNTGNVTYLLTGKVFCGTCGGPMAGECGKSHTGKTYNYYKCSNRKRGKGCDKKSISKEKLEVLVVEKTKELVMQDKIINYIADQVLKLQKREAGSTPKSGIELEIKRISKKIDNLLDAVSEGINIPSVMAKITALENQKLNYQAQLSQINDMLYNLSKDQIVFWLSKFKNGEVENISYQQQLIDTFVRAVYCYEEKIIITYNYTEYGPGPPTHGKFEYDTRSSTRPKFSQVR